MAFFGFPVAHEDSAQRAVQAALEIVAACAQLNADSRLRERGTEIAVRVGVATGIVVAGSAEGRPDADGRRVVGFALNLAFKLQGVAAPNTAVVSASTHALTAGLFEFRPGPLLTVDGISGQQPSWTVQRARRPPTRFDALRSRRLVPLVYRQKEMATLERAWASARAGRGRTVLISGEPGIGKSRLALAARRTIVGRGHFRVTLQCSSQRTDTALYPITTELERHLAPGPRQHDSEALRHRLARLVVPAGINAARVVPLLAGLLSPPEARPPAKLEGISSEIIKERLFGALLDVVEGLSRRWPALIVVEDAHWIDPTSRELLDALIDRLQHLAVLLLVTARPSFVPSSWLEGQECTLMRLRRLARRQCTMWVRRLAGDQPLPPTTMERIVVASEGVPLFVEELSFVALDTRAGHPADGLSGAVAQTTIPASLSDLFTARLDQLGVAAKELVQAGSAIGRSFSVDLAQQAAAADDVLVEDTLGRLVDLGLAAVRGRARQRICTFRHVLTQEATYQSMLRDTRRAMHRRIAKLLKHAIPDAQRAAPEVLAYHYAEAGDISEAVDNYHQAGRLAAARSANIEAKRLLSRALELLRALPPSRERDDQELSLLVALGPVMITTSGPGAPDVRMLYEKAVSLCERLPQSPLQFPAYWGWWRVAPDFKAMHDRAQDLAKLARDLSDEQLLLQAHHCQWATLFMLGEQEACCAHIAEGLRLYDAGEYQAQGILYGGHDPKGCALGEQALSIWLQGFPDVSLVAIGQCLAHTQALRHAGSTAHALDQEIMVWRYRRQAARVLNLARSMRAFAAEHRFADLGTKADVFEGWALAAQGRARTGIELIEQGLARQRAIGTQEDFPVYFEMLAEAYNLGGQPDRGLPLIEEAIGMAARTGLQYWTAELFRQQGELLQAAGADSADALACLDRANALATTQRAHSLHLRAATSKARILVSVGQGREAYDCLAPVHAAFTEGFDTPDWRDARRLLEQLR